MNNDPQDSSLPPQESDPRKRWLRFRLRTVIIIVTVFAIGAGLIQRRANQRMQATRMIQELGGQIVYDKSDRRTILRTALRWMYGEAFAPVSAIRLSDTNANDDAVHALRAFPELQNISLRESMVSDQGIGELATLRNLTTIELNGTAAGDSCLAALSQLNHLEHLNLARTLVTDKGVEQLSSLPQLAFLDISGTDVTSRALESISSIHSLEHLVLQGTRISGNGLPVLGRLSNLRSVDLYGADLRDNGAKQLASILSLETIVLSGTGVTDDVMVAFDDHPNLAVLNVSQTEVSQEAIQGFKARNPGCAVNVRPQR